MLQEQDQPLHAGCREVASGDVTACHAVPVNGWSARAEVMNVVNVRRKWKSAWAAPPGGSSVSLDTLCLLLPRRHELHLDLFCYTVYIVVIPSCLLSNESSLYRCVVVVDAFWISDISVDASGSPHHHSYSTARRFLRSRCRTKYQVS